MDFQFGSKNVSTSSGSLNYEDAKNIHLYIEIQNINNFNHGISPKLVSIINRMLEKNPKKRFSNWDEIRQVLKLPSGSNSSLDNVVEMAVAAKNNINLQRQKQESELQKKEKEKAEFCKLVHSQFDNTIISILKKYVDKSNLEYAGTDKFVLKYNRDRYSRNNYISCRLLASENKYVDIKLEIVFKENHVRKIPIRDSWNICQYREENDIPQYRGKNIMALGEISNSIGWGYNILLVDSGDIYGDWIIMNNKNNLSYAAPGKEITEPFAFSIEELPAEINKVQMTHLYRSEFLEYTDDKFLRIVNMLAFFNRKASV